MCSTQMIVIPRSLADAPQHLGGLPHLALIEAAETFVGQQQARAGRQRLSQFELLQPGGAEPGDRQVAVDRQPDQGQRPFRRLERGRRWRPWP